MEATNPPVEVPAPPAAFTANISVPEHILHLAQHPPPRKIFIINPMPPEAEFIRAVNTDPGQPRDTLRLVWLAVKVFNDNDNQGRDHVLDELAFSFYVSGWAWPVAVRAAVLAACPWALTLEQRLAAIEERQAKIRKGPPPPVYSVQR